MQEILKVVQHPIWPYLQRNGSAGAKKTAIGSADDDSVGSSGVFGFDTAQLAQKLGRDPSGMSAAASRFESRMKREKELAARGGKTAERTGSFILSGLTRMTSLTTVLHAMGLRLAVEVEEPEAA